MANTENTPLPITAIILAHEETELLRQAITAVDWADEILVVWNHPTALFPKELKSKQVKVVSRPEKISNFASLRNKAARMAKHKWVFYLDSDEVVKPEIASVLAPLLEGKRHVFAFKRRDIFLGQELKWGEVKNIRVTRFFHRDYAKYVRPVHEVVEAKEGIKLLSPVIYHVPHDSIETFLKKVGKYLELEVTAQQGKPMWRIILELFTFPPGKFIWNYIVQLGFLDGWRGFIYSTVMSIHSFGVRARLYEKTARK